MIRKITRDELIGMRKTGQQFRLVDVLSAESFVKEHIPQAISLPLADIEKRAEEVLRKDEVIVVYCASFECQASTKAAEKLIALGYQNVLDYKGGLKDYKDAHLPLEGSLHEASSCASCCGCK
ncbi:MAG: rhodanese-like domain-containing protein [Candidatus Omnitrophica bacterium]|nr:rhodanese-like domain-containing protein [Candidatus Omnitrophota bacterium]